MAYVDGFVLPVPKKNIKDYQKIAKKASKIWMEHGALAYHEAEADDNDAKGMVSFPELAKVKTGETVVFAWIVYKSKAHRDSVNKKVMKDPRMATMCGSAGMPFDPKRIAYGGFKTLVEA